MDKPKIDTATVYRKVAELLPLEGRDFTIDAAYDENHKTKLIITPLTAIGRAWIPFLQKELEEPMGKSGVTLTTGGMAARETVTIASVRAKVEVEAEAARKAKISDAENLHAQKYKEAQAARQARIAASGEQAPLTEVERAANRASNDASVIEWRTKRIVSKIPAIRKSIDEAALQAAKDDETKGKFWAVDMNAPLTSLFDQQDVAAKLRKKEELIDQMAQKAAELDELRDSAVMTAKQYIIQK